MSAGQPFLGVPDRVRRVIAVLGQLSIWSACFVGAFLLRFDFAIPVEFERTILIALPVLLALRVGFFLHFGLFKSLWRYTGTRDLTAIARATALSSAAFVLFSVFAFRTFPRSIFIIDGLGALMAVGGTRLATRLVREVTRTSQRAAREARRRKVLVIGAGDAGESLLRELQRGHSGRYDVAGVVDDNVNKIGALIHGVRVLGGIADVPRLARDLSVEEIIIAIPSATGLQMRRIVETCKEADVQVRTIPGVDQLIDGVVFTSQIRNVAIEDVLGREPVTLDTQAISELVAGRTLLVSGAGGSIGSEVCRQLCKFNPAVLVLLEQAENALYQIHRELGDRFPAVRGVPVVCDIADAKRLGQTFAAHRPSMVVHAAAHKHVPMMEWNAGEAVKNNVFGSKNVADASDAYGVERFVMISTDKAVNPTSIMGATKRVAEIYVQYLSARSRTRFVNVRFGNVLGSNGSVIPLFLEQIARGGPITVTHPEMKRYFMTIPEASQLVLQAATMGKGGEIFILDMGMPLKIVDLARDLVTLSGLRPDEDIEIRFTGMRPGEKLFEELSVAAEHADTTRHPKIFVGRQRSQVLDALPRSLGELSALSEGTNEAALRAKLKELVPECVFSVDAEAAPQSSQARAEVIPLRRA